MFDFFELSNYHLIFAIVMSVINGLILCFLGSKFFQIMQLSGYHNRGYFDWLKTSGGIYVGRLAMVSVLSAACMIVTDVIFQPFSEYFAYIGFAFYVIFCIVFIWNVYCSHQKVPLKQTNRINRAFILLWLIGAILTFGLLIVFENYVFFFRLGGLVIPPLLLPLLVPLVFCIMRPLENAISRTYIRKTKRKLAKYPELIKIGITGSFGKTSTKNFLATILREKYNVCATPFNFNTPLGISRTVLQNLDFGHQVLIAEMGARQLGDIKELCEIVQPKYGILTAIGAQHIATFLNQENVKRTKAELPNYLGKDGVCVFDMDNEIVREIASEAPCRKITVSLNDSKADIFASDIHTSSQGTKFTLHFGGKSFECSTKLLGLHNISNLLLSVGLARELGLSEAEILSGISKVYPVEHRLQLINAKGNITILDDTYNSSVDGSQRALEVLSMFEGRRKVVVTPGLVELGTMERLENYNFGKRIANVADVVIIVNRAHLASIKQGLLDASFDEGKIYEAIDMNATQETLKSILVEGDVVLWENDLPDNYI